MRGSWVVGPNCPRQWVSRACALRESRMVRAALLFVDDSPEDTARSGDTERACTSDIKAERTGWPPASSASEVRQRPCRQRATRSTSLQSPPRCQRRRSRGPSTSPTWPCPPESTTDGVLSCVVSTTSWDLRCGWSRLQWHPQFSLHYQLDHRSSDGDRHGWHVCFTRMLTGTVSGKEVAAGEAVTRHTRCDTPAGLLSDFSAERAVALAGSTHSLGLPREKAVV